MNARLGFCWTALLLAFSVASPPAAAAQERKLPDALEPWKDWATWDDRFRDCPATYANGDDRICFWPSTLALRATPQGGSFSGKFTVFARTWVPLPGSPDMWPLHVTRGGEPIAVFERDGRPAVELSPGSHELSGEFVWDDLPEKIALPPTIGLLSLDVSGQGVALPDWDEQGQVWLQRARAAETADDVLSAQVYRLLEDGIPLWLNTEIELTVAGKSREEELGWVLPEGWKLATVDSPIPVAVDDRGVMKAQVRAGKWTIRMRAFRTDDARSFGYAADSQPIVSHELVGLRGSPSFRLAQLEGLDAIDASQTAYPAAWRDAPAYRWDVSKPFQLNEKVRGMGLQRPEGLSIDRVLWLDVEGESPTITYRDRVTGSRQQIWRLDAAAGQQLGRVRINGEGQLITSNTQTKAQGVEIRDRNLDLEAIGKAPLAATLPATGWQSDADSLHMTLTLPPGWRALAVLGADRVDGDWLTAWSLLDLFLLLIFSLAVFRLWGFWAGVIAFVGFGLSYHEPGAPRLTWLFLLMPVAILAAGPSGGIRRWLERWKYLAAALLLFNLVPFVAFQTQSVIYPQLEHTGVQYAPRSMFWHLGAAYRGATQVASIAFEDELASSKAEVAGEPFRKAPRFDNSNLAYDPQAVIQTGPAEPTWSWNQVHCAWDGPVAADQQIRPILVTLGQHRVLTVGRVALLLVVAAILFGVRRLRLPRVPAATPAATAALALALGIFAARGAQAADIPSPETLQTLRNRLLEPSDAYPHAAEIATAALRVVDHRVTLETEIHTALTAAVPLPGRLPVWSPLSVTVDGKPAELVCRRDGYLWVALPAGVHRVNVESLLPDVTEWEWTFLLKPRRVTIDAPEWTVSGLRPNGMVESQIFFNRQRETPAGEAAYDRKDFNAVVAVDRYLEIGLIWQVRTEVTRLAASGKAVSLKLPLLPGERVLSANMVVENGLLEASLAAGQDTFSWVSELPLGQDLTLAAPPADQGGSSDPWVERWRLATSPMWNVTYKGLTPIYEADEQKLLPIWLPWPGEQVQLAFSRPEAVRGETVTVQQVTYSTTLGSRHRTSQMKLDIDASMGTDFAIKLTQVADITSLTVGGQMIEPRRADDHLLVPIPPGRQVVEVQWRTATVLHTFTAQEPVELPVAASNITSVLSVPESRWILWADGPLIGPAVRFWTILVVAVLFALVVGSLPNSPLRRFEWVLLAIGLTQVHVAAALLVVGWLFLLAWRGKRDPDAMTFWRFDLQQIALVVITLMALGVLVVTVGAGLLGDPEMFVSGNGSYRNLLHWFQPNADRVLPEPNVVSVSIWFYRLLMLAWALWLAVALLRWLQWGWTQFNHRGAWRRKPQLQPTSP